MNTDEVVGADPDFAQSSDVFDEITPPEGQSYRLTRWEGTPPEKQLDSGSQRGGQVASESMPWHFHLELELTLYCRGVGACVVGDRVESLGAGDVLLLGENVPHYWRMQGRATGLSLQWHFPASHGFWMFPETVTLAACFREARRGIRYRGATAETLTDLLQQLENARQEGKFSIFIQVLSTLAGAAPADKNLVSSQLIAIRPVSHHTSAIQAAVRFILVHFRDEIRLSQLLEVTHTSRATFAREFKKHSGKTLTQFVQQVRLDAACRELVGTNAPITEVGFQNGFTELSFFNRVFHRQMGCTPSDYRARGRRSCRPFEREIGSAYTVAG